MIELTKLNGEVILINPDQMEYIEIIPESKIIMVNGRYHIVEESKEIIVEKIIQYKRSCGNLVAKLEG